MGSPALGRLNAPRPALVETGPGTTPRIVNREQVTLVREEWRVVDRWWTDEPVDRHYFEVVLEGGRNVCVYRDARGAAAGSRRTPSGGRRRACRSARRAYSAPSPMPRGECDEVRRRAACGTRCSRSSPSAPDRRTSRRPAVHVPARPSSRSNRSPSDVEDVVALEELSVGLDALFAQLAELTPVLDEAAGRVQVEHPYRRGRSRSGTSGRRSAERGCTRLECAWTTSSPTWNSTSPSRT